MSSAILLLFLSFNLSPLSCQASYVKFFYHPSDEVMDFIFHKKVVGFHLVAPFISIGCFIAWFVTNIICFIIHLCELHHHPSDGKIFENKKVDSDADTENEDNERHYEINRVVFS